MTDLHGAVLSEDAEAPSAVCRPQVDWCVEMSVSKCRLKAVTDWHSRTSGGNEFQMEGGLNPRNFPVAVADPE